MTDSVASDALRADAPLSVPPGSVERAARDWVRKGRRDLTSDEQAAEARRIAAGLPDLREPKLPKMSPVPVRSRIDAFLGRLRSIPRADWRRIAGAVAHEKRELFRYYELRYVRSSLTDYRNRVRSTLGAGHPAVRYLHLNVDDQSAVNTVNKAQVNIRETALRPIDPDDLVDVAVRLLDGDTIFEIGVALCILTGRRPVELYKLADFLPVDIAHVRFIRLGEPLYSGQAKTKGAKSSMTAPYIIPVLADPERIIEALGRMRSMRRLTGESEERINQLVAKPMSDVIQQYQIADGWREKLQIKELRAAYAEIAFTYFAPRNITKLAYFHQILGHAALDDTSARSYLKFYIDGHLGDTLADNDLAKRPVLVGLYQERDLQTDARQRQFRDDRIRVLEGTMDFASRESAWRLAGVPVDPSIAQRAALVREIASSLSPAQRRLVRDVANGRTGYVARDRKTLELLVARGVFELRPGADHIQVVALTGIGHEVRTELRPFDPAPSTDAADAN